MASIPRPTRIGLSQNNSVQNRPTGNTVTLADMAPSDWATPAQVIAYNQSSTNGSGATLRYPADVPQYWMQIGVHNYHRASWLEVGQLTLLGSIVLPLPQQLVDHGMTEYETVELGVPGGMAQNAIGGAAGFFQNGITSGTGSDLAQNIVGAGGAALNQALQIIPGGGAAAAAASATFGVSVNQFQTVMLKGPTYKDHQFTWHFSADTAEESQTLSRIKAALDDAKAPSLTGYTGSVFWLWPRIVTVGFRNAEIGDMGGRLFRLKPSVITDVMFDFTAPGQPAFYRGTKAAQSMSMTLKLREIEYWLRGDPAMGGF